MTSLRDFPFFDEVGSSSLRSGRGIGCVTLPEIEENRHSRSRRSHRPSPTPGEHFLPLRALWRPPEGIALQIHSHNQCQPLLCLEPNTSLPALVCRSQWPQSHPSSLRAAQAQLRSPNIHQLSTSPTNCCHLLFPFHPMLPLLTQHSLRPPLLPSTPIPSSSHDDTLSIMANHPFWIPFSALSTSIRAQNSSMFSRLSRLMEQMISLIPFATCTSTV